VHNKKLVPYEFFKCPNCGYLTLSLTGIKVDNEVKYLCPRCGGECEESEWKTVKRKVWAFKCETCGKYVENISENWNWCGAFEKELLCPVCLRAHRDCLVAIDGHHVSKIRTVRQDRLKQSQQVSDDLYLLEALTKWDRMTLRYLNYLAKKEEQSFKIMPRETLRNYILLSRDKFIGYLAWTQEKPPTLRQIFVTKEERRKRYATKLVQHFVNTQCPKPDERGALFNVESPNNASLRLLEKLGYVKMEKDGAIGLKVRFVRSL